MMTNAGVKEFFDKYPGRTCAIHLNNAKSMLIDYEGKYQTKTTDISYETVGGCDLLVVDHVDISSGREVHFKSYVVTEFIESIDVMSAEDAQYRLDPLKIL